MRPGRFQYRPLSVKRTFLHSAWLELPGVEFSVYRTYLLKGPEPWTFRINIGSGRVVIDIKQARGWR